MQFLRAAPCRSIRPLLICNSKTFRDQPLSVALAAYQQRISRFLSFSRVMLCPHGNWPTSRWPISSYAGHVYTLEGVSPLWRLMALTISRRQLRHREVSWEGSPIQTCDLRYTNRIGGVSIRASQRCMTKPIVIKGSVRICGRCAGKVCVLIPGDLDRCPRCHSDLCGRSCGGLDDHGCEVVVDGRGVSRGHIRSGNVVCSEGLNMVRDVHCDAGVVC